MPTYEILYSTEGWGSTYITANSEAEARDQFDAGEWEPQKEDFYYELQDIDEVGARERRIAERVKTFSQRITS